MGSLQRGQMVGAGLLILAGLLIVVFLVLRALRPLGDALRPLGDATESLSQTGANVAGTAETVSSSALDLAMFVGAGTSTLNPGTHASSGFSQAPGTTPGLPNLMARWRKVSHKKVYIFGIGTRYTWEVEVTAGGRPVSGAAIWVEGNNPFAQKEWKRGIYGYTDAAGKARVSWLGALVFTGVNAVLHVWVAKAGFNGSAPRSIGPYQTSDL